MLLAAAVPVRAGEVKVSFSNGLVTIVATDASPRQILAEWAKLGQVRVTNLERLSGGPITIQLTNVPEAQALETLLRGTAGYVAAPRPRTGAAAAASLYDRILLMPGTAPPVPVSTPGQPPVQLGGPGRGRMSAPVYDAPGEDETNQPRTMPGPNGPARGAQRPGGAGFPGQVVMPGQTVSPGQYVMPGSPYQPAGGYGGAAGQVPPAPSASRTATSYATPQAPPGAVATVPGTMTAPAPLPATPYSNLPLTPVDQSAATAGEAAALPGPPTVGGLRPGEIPASPGKTPGATTPGATTPGATTPTGPIKKDPGAKG
jgi:hypothetical protein